MLLACQCQNLEVSFFRARALAVAFRDDTLSRLSRTMNLLFSTPPAQRADYSPQRSIMLCAISPTPLYQIMEWRSSIIHAAWRRPFALERYGLRNQGKCRTGLTNSFKALMFET